MTLLKTDIDMITKSHTQNPKAYELYLKGRFHIIRRGASILTGIQHIKEAIETDPGFALAYAVYADANLLLATYGLVSPKQVMPGAKQLAEKAIQLDPTLCEPYCALGYYYACYEWNWAEAKKNLLKSLELNPRYAEVNLRYGCNYLTWVEGKFEEGEKYGQMAIKVEPLHSVCYGTHSLILQTAGKFNEALEVCKMGIDLDANSFLCRLNEGNIYKLIHQYDESISSYETALKISNRHHFAVNGLIWSYCATGNIKEALILMNELKERSTKEYIAYTFYAISAACLNDLDQAFEFLEKAINDRDPVLLAIKYEKWVPDNLKKDIRYQQLLDRIGFPK
jgi:tetratricopeptide (TPR) repeat protein